MVYIGHMYVNKRIKLAQQGIALQKIYVLLFIIIVFSFSWIDFVFCFNLLSVQSAYI